MQQLSFASLGRILPTHFADANRLLHGRNSDPIQIDGKNQVRGCSCNMAGFFKEILASNGAFKFYMNGQWKESDSGIHVDIINPFTLLKQYKIQGTVFRAYYYILLAIISIVFRL